MKLRFDWSGAEVLGACATCAARLRAQHPPSRFESTARASRHGGSTSKAPHRLRRGSKIGRAKRSIAYGTARRSTAQRAQRTQQAQVLEVVILDELDYDLLVRLDLQRDQKESK